MSKHKKLLFSGEPPLKLSTANSIQEMIEKALETALTDGQIKLFQKRLILEWQEGKKSRREINKAEKMAEEINEQIEALPIEKQPFAWREFGRQVYVYAENEGKDDPLGQLIMTLYQAKHVLLVKGNPPLSRQAAESYAEMATFIHNVANNALVSLDPTEKEEVINDLVKNFSSYPLEQQENISQADALWGQLRYNWKIASQEDKENFRTEIQIYLPKQKTQPLQTKSTTLVIEETQLETENKLEQVEQSLEQSAEQKSQAEITPQADSTSINSENTTTKASKASEIITKILPSKFLDTVNRLRAKVGKVTLIPTKKPD